MRLSRQVYIYFISYFFNAGLSFYTISKLTNKLEPYDYGIINLYGSFITLLTPFITGGILYPLSIEYYKKNEDDYRQFFTNAQAIPLISLGVFTAICLFLCQPISAFLRVTPLWVIVLPFATWWIMNNEMALILYRVKNKPWHFALLSVGRNLAETSITLALVIGLHWAWPGRLTALVIAPTLLGLIAVNLFFRWHLIASKIDWQQVKRIAWVCVPFIFERLTVFVLSNSDRYFIDKFDHNGTNQVGLYSVGSQLASIISVVILSMNSAYQPYIFQNLANGNKAKAKKATGLYILAVAVIIAALFAGMPLLFHYFIGGKFKEGRIFAYYLSGAYFMWAIYNAFLVYLLFNGKNRLVLFLSVTGMSISIALNFVLVPLEGAFGAAITSITTYTCMAILSIIYSWKYFKQT